MRFDLTVSVQRAIEWAYQNSRDMDHLLIQTFAARRVRLEPMFVRQVSPVRTRGLPPAPAAPGVLNVIELNRFDWHHEDR
ncbi:MAG TPA: hypothetical protein VLA93_18215 [Pyrinomonadaceae bacterium]|nr:hypothetical protein [Pyrinomonadaceae bacterium]